MIIKFRIFEGFFYDEYDSTYYSYGDGYETPKTTYKKTDEDKIRTWKEEGIDFFYNYSVKDFIDLLKRDKLHISRHDNQVLEYTVIEDELEMFKELMKHQKMDLTFEENYMLRKAVRVGNVEFIKELLKYGEVDPTVDSDILIRAASQNGNIKIVKILLNDDRVNPTTYNNYALVESISNGHIEVANLLLDDDRVHPASFNLDPLLYALADKHEELVERLMKYKGVLKKLSFNHLVAYEVLYNYVKRNPNLLKYIKLTDKQKRELFPVYKPKKIIRSID